METSNPDETFDAADAVFAPFVVGAVDGIVLCDPERGNRVFSGEAAVQDYTVYVEELRKERQEARDG